VYDTHRNSEYHVSYETCEYETYETYETCII
jgi:hypothetical protein